MANDLAAALRSLANRDPNPSPSQRGMHMGARGPTLFLNANSPSNRRYTPNPFSAAPTGQAVSPSPAPMPVTPPVGVAPPSFVGGQTGGIVGALRGNRPQRL